MIRRLEWGGEWIATLIEGADETYIVPPIVVDPDGTVIMGRYVLEAVVQSGETIKHPVIRNCSPGDLAALEQKLAAMSEELGVPAYVLDGPDGEDDQ